MSRESEPRLSGDNDDKPGMHVVTPKWLREHQASANILRNRRNRDPNADTSLIIPAAQHPLIVGSKPGDEFEKRLRYALDMRNRIVDNGGKVNFFLTGNRHHDSISETTDAVALYDASGKWLLDHKVPAAEIHGKDWTDEFNTTIYNGADEIRVAALGFKKYGHLRDATYICSPGQESRAKTYALAYELPLDVVVPESLKGDNAGQFHGGLKNMALQGLTNAIDPYGALLSKITQDRIPTDGQGVGTPKSYQTVLYAELPWYNNPPQA